MAAISCRGGCLPLAIETGRLQTPKIRFSCCLCIHCNSGDIDMMLRIFHISVVLYCKNYNNICLSMFKYVPNLIPTFFPYLARFS